MSISKDNVLSPNATLVICLSRASASLRGCEPLRRSRAPTYEQRAAQLIPSLVIRNQTTSHSTQHHGNCTITTWSAATDSHLVCGIGKMASTTSPDDPLAGQSSEPVAKLPLQQGSCVTCRRRKVKCDRKPFCSNCERLGLRCEYAPRKRAPRQPRKTDGLSTREVELIKRLNKLEGGYSRPRHI
jgi:hypothetical protein